MKKTVKIGDYIEETTAYGTEAGKSIKIETELPIEAIERLQNFADEAQVSITDVVETLLTADPYQVQECGTLMLGI